MNNNLLLLSYENTEIRFVGDAEKPEWVGADIVAVLYPEADSRNYSNYLSKVPDEWKGHKKIMTLGGEQEMVTVFEAGLYSLIARSNSPIAVPFQKWVYEEVLPSIRKTGSYGAPDQTETPEVLKFTGDELDEMLKQAKLMQVLATSGNFKLRNAVRQNLEIQWGLEPTKELEFPRIVSSDISNKELAYQWFLDSNNPDQHWHVPSGDQITITNLYKKFTSYCEVKGTTPLKKTVFSKALVELGFKRIDSNYIYFILPNRPA